MKAQKRNCTGFCLLVAIVCLLGACATMQARSTETTGFLKDYSQLKEGGDGKLNVRKPAELNDERRFAIMEVT